LSTIASGAGIECLTALRQVGETLLRAERHDDLALGVELDIEAPGVVGGIGAAQAGDAFGGRIAVRLGVLRRLDQLGDDMRRRGAVGITHAEIDHILPGGSPLGLQRVDFREDVRGEALDAIEFFGHGDSAGGWLSR
jgi:hypothetical protein